MVTRTKWIERKFAFDCPLGLFPCILERLRGTPARLEEIIDALSSEVLTTRIGDAWSIQEHTGHLADLDPLHDGRVDDYLSGVEVLRAADVTGRRTTEANHNDKNIQDILRLFRDGRMKFVERLANLDDKIVAQTALHPRLNQPMRVIDMAVFTAEHDDHHVACITELVLRLEEK